MDLANHTTVLMSTQRLPDTPQAPEWIHLLPAGANGVIQTDDKRGPYLAGKADEVIAASFAVHDRLPIDENHATDIAAPKGQPAPARGWITEMQARDDGIWGKVEWTSEGAELVTSKAYRDISPVIMVDKSKQVRVIPRASLVNEPNLRGLVSLHQKEKDMALRDLLITALGLAKDASDDGIVTALNSRLKDDVTPALQSAMTQVGAALGLKDDAKPDEIIAAAQAKQSAGPDENAKDGLITELQSSVQSLTKELGELKGGLAAGASEAFYEKALQERRAGVGPASKEYWVSLHQKDPKGTEDLVATFPKLDGSGTSLEPPQPKEGEVHLNSSQKSIASQLGLSNEDYAKQLQKVGGGS